MPRQPNPSVSVRYSTANPCQGVNKDIDRSILERTELVSGVNLRVKAGSVVCRGGQVKRNDVAMDGAVYGFIDTEGEFDGFIDPLYRQSTYPGLYTFPTVYFDAVPATAGTRFYGAGPSYQNIWTGYGHPDGPVSRISEIFGRTIQPFRSRLVAVAWQNGAPYLWDVVLGFGGDAWFDRLVAIDYATVGNVLDFCVRVESGEEILYCSTTLGRILRWDGTDLTVVHTMALETSTRIACIDGDKLFAAAGNGAYYASPAPCAYQLTVGGAWTDIATPYAGIGHYDGLGPEYITALSEFQGVCVISGQTGAVWPNSGGTWFWDPASPSALSVAWGNAQAVHPAPLAVDWRTGTTANDGRVQPFAGVVAGGKYFAMVGHFDGLNECSLLVASSLSPTDFELVAIPGERLGTTSSLVLLHDNVVYLSPGFPSTEPFGRSYGLIMVDSSNNNPIWYFPIHQGDPGFDPAQLGIEDSFLIPDPNLPDPTSDPDIPVASFTFSPTTGARPLTVNFTDTSTSGSDPITDWEWIFSTRASDGAGYSNDQNPSFTFGGALAGVCTVRLKVTNSKGSSFCKKFFVVT